MEFKQWLKAAGIRAIKNDSTNRYCHHRNVNNSRQCQLDSSCIRIPSCRWTFDAYQRSGTA